MHNDKRCRNFFIILFTGMLAWSCAVVTPPDGGPKDIKPPAAVSITPPMGCIGFNSEKIRIRFDEFIQLKDIGYQLIVSPPLKTMPEVKVKGKWLIVKMPGGLQDSATYNLFFGKAIADFTEGNATSDFQYVFSTGSKLDSGEVSGKIINAFSLEPAKEIFVMLYRNMGDSVPLKERPVYVARTDEGGNFRFRYISITDYKIFALKDVNNNYLYDMPNEEIAFSDSVISVHVHNHTEKDSTGAPETMLTETPVEVNLYLFTEEDTAQKLMSAVSPVKNQYALAFKHPVKSLALSISDTNIRDPWYEKEWNSAGDTLKIWLQNIPTGSFRIAVSDRGKVLDSVLVSMGKEPDVKQARKIKTSKNSFAFITGSKTTADYFRPFTLSSPCPLLQVNLKPVVLIEDKDTLTIVPEFGGSNKRTLTIPHKLKEGATYRLIIPDSCYQDMYLRYNDTVKLNFKTGSAQNYGSLSLSIRLKDKSSHYLIQLMPSTKEAVLSETITNDKTLRYEHLNPGTYFLKAIRDSNNNGKWDTGNYLRHEQPEKVFMKQGSIVIKENWEQEAEWEF